MMTPLQDQIITYACFMEISVDIDNNIHLPKTQVMNVLYIKNIKSRVFLIQFLLEISALPIHKHYLTLVLFTLFTQTCFFFFFFFFVFFFFFGGGPVCVRFLQFTTTEPTVSWSLLQCLR